MSHSSQRAFVGLCQMLCGLFRQSAVPGKVVTHCCSKAILNIYTHSHIHCNCNVAALESSQQLFDKVKATEAPALNLREKMVRNVAGGASHSVGTGSRCTNLSFY